MIVLKKQIIEIPFFSLTPLIDNNNRVLVHYYFSKIHKLINLTISVYTIYFFIFVLALTCLLYLLKKIALITSKVRNQYFFNTCFYITLIFVGVLFILNSLFIGYEQEFLYGHIKLTHLNYKITVLLYYVNFMFWYIIYKILFFNGTKAKYFYYIYAFIIILFSPCLYFSNSTLSFFFLIELLSFLFFFIIIVHLQYNPYYTGNVNSDKHVHKILFKKNFFSVSIYFWIATLISLLFYILYYCYVYTTLHINWFSFNNVLNDLMIFPHTKINSIVVILFYIFIFFKAGWLPFFVWKVSFVRHLNTHILFIYLLYYYVIVLLYFQYLINFYLYYFLINNFHYAFGILIFFLLFIGYLSYTITSFNTFLLTSSILNSFLIITLMLLLCNDSSVYNYYVI